MSESQNSSTSLESGVHQSPYCDVPEIDEDRTLATQESLGFWRSLLAPLILALVGLVALCLFSWNHLLTPSPDTHFVYQADALLHGELELRRSPPHGNDWATFVEMELPSGQVVRGVWFDRDEDKFITLSGEMFIISAEDRRGVRQNRHHFVSFPPGPAVLMMPGVAIWGYDFNDVWFTLFFAALNIALIYVLLRRLSRGGRSSRSVSDNIWLTFLFGFGTVALWCSVFGQVWFTALVVGATFTLLYLLCAIDARHPILAGLFLACAFATRTPLLFSAILFYAFVLFPGGRFRREGWKGALWKIAQFSVIPLLVGLSLLYMNYVRFEQFAEFGHRYLAEGGIDRIREYGLFNYHFLAKNLSALFTLLPRFQLQEPYVLLSKHGMSIFLTTPVFFYLFRSRQRRYRQDVFFYRLFWVTVFVIAIPHLFYQNTGWSQYGYRFSLDYTPYLIVLLAIGRYPLTRIFKFLVLLGFIVNAFGAATFNRFDQFYTDWFFDP